MEGTRNQAFQTLKPICVSLSQSALSLNGPKGNIKAVTDQLEQLKSTLSAIALKPANNVLDSKLADYAFFPLSHLLKLGNRLPIRCLELSLQSIAILVDQGWRQQIQPQLAAQVVIFCTLLAEKKPKGFSFTDSTDELQSAAFWCLHHVFEVSRGSPECQALFASESSFPQLGQTITIILSGIHDGGDTEVQIAATSALEALVDVVADREICARFLPGIVSKLTNVLTPSTKLRRNRRVLVGCLDLLGRMLMTTLGDEPASTKRAKGAKGGASIIDEKWKETAATQLKLALTSILRLQSDSREDVKDALAKICLTLLEHCRKALANCSASALEAVVTLSASEHDLPVRMQLELLVQGDPPLAGLLQTTVHDWLQSLPTLMQSSDEQAKVRKLEQIYSAHGLLVDCGVDTGVIDRMLAASLRDSMVIMLQIPGSRKQASDLISPVQSLDLAALDGTKHGTDFGQPLVRYRGQEEVMASIDSLTKRINQSSTSPAFAADLARSLRLSHGEQQIANFWLLLTATQSALRREDAVSEFLDLGLSDYTASYHDYLEELYSFSMSVLANSSIAEDEEPLDPRLKALALRALALRAQTAGQEFRYELVDALYPVLHALATPHEMLQADGITTLNIFAAACGYSNIEELIVENVDYLTNAVALKLNAFDVSPQAPQVLLMMARLAGSALVPYLEDTVESIFAVLESYHGYGVLVELLFKVLAVVAEEGARAPVLAVAERKAIEASGVLDEVWQPTSVKGLEELLRERRTEEHGSGNDPRRGDEPHPQKPWNGSDSPGEDGEDAESAREDGDDNEVKGPSDEERPPPAPKTYNLLLKITELTQHFLPSASPSLRASLLSLIRTTIPAIARHENSFLPLLNTLWPEIVSRLEDAEPHVQATALEIVSVMCEHAGSFMRSRIVQLWPLIEEVYDQTSKDIIGSNGSGEAKRQRPGSKESSSTALVRCGPSLKQAIARLQASPADYTNTSARLMWNALADCLKTVVRYVQLPPELFDVALEMLASMLEVAEVRLALDKENSDAVWLARTRSGATAIPRLPKTPADSNWRFAEVLG